MITGSTILAWLSSYAGGLVVKLLADALTGWLAGRRASATERELGAARERLDQASKTIAAQGAELEAQANAPRTEDDAIRRLEEGSA